MKKLFLLFVVTGAIISTNAQPVIKKELKKSITLTMPRTADDECLAQGEQRWSGIRFKKNIMLLWRVI